MSEGHVLNENIPTPLEQMDTAIALAWREDIGSGDVTSAACIPEDARETAGFMVKGTGVIAGLEAANRVFAYGAPDVEFKAVASDGDEVRPGDVVAWASGSARQILTAERLALNFMQRMSGIATGTRQVVALLEGTGTRVLDTRKTTPGIRAFEKAAVQIGGGVNHRMGLYDQILIKDNHVDYAGSMAAAVQGALDFLEAAGRKVPVVVEVRNAQELQDALAAGGVDRLLLDNFTPAQARAAVDLVGGRVHTEASGGLNPDNVRSYGEAGVDFVSLGWLTHSPIPLDISLKSASFLQGIKPPSNG